MKTLQIAISLTSVLLVSCTNTDLSERRNWLKEYAYCRCLEYARNDSTFFKEDLSISVYREIANYDPLVYDTIDSLAKKFANSILPSEIPDHAGRKSIPLHCFIFLRSKELDSVVRKFDEKMLPGFE